MSSYLATTSARAVARAGRIFALVAALVTLVAVVGVLATGVSHGGRLDPRSAEPDGALALAQLARHHGHQVEITDTLPPLDRSTSPLTVVITPTSQLGPGRAAALQAGLTLGWQLLLVEPDPSELLALGVRAHITGTTPTGLFEPACALPEAQAAGVADTGGWQFSTGDGPVAAVGCYASSGDPTLVRLPPGGTGTGSGTGSGTVTLIGSGLAFTNHNLDHEGNAALGLALLRQTAHLLWLLPGSGAGSGAGDGSGSASVSSLLPRGVLVAIWQLLIAVLLVALWRGRRLGPPVAEVLPVVVRGAETVEGRARLYRSARARGRAAEALRAGSRARLAGVLGLGREPVPEVLVERVAARAPHPPATVGDLLYGAGWPTDRLNDRTNDITNDAGLVRLARLLTALEREVRRS